jgi:hypothetical protein
MDQNEISEDNYELHLFNAAAIGVRLGKPAKEMVAEIKAAAGANRTISKGIDPHEISEENYEVNLLKAAAIGVQLGMSAEEIAVEMKNVVNRFWQIHRERN